MTKVSKKTKIVEKEERVKASKLLHLNLKNDKERLINEWLEDGFVNFSSIVKQLLYKEAIKDEHFMEEYRKNHNISH